jgi:ABC-type ATPase involved in cell division
MEEVRKHLLRESDKFDNVNNLKISLKDFLQTVTDSGAGDDTTMGVMYNYNHILQQNSYGDE